MHISNNKYKNISVLIFPASNNPIKMGNMNITIISDEMMITPKTLVMLFLHNFIPTIIYKTMATILNGRYIKSIILDIKR